MAPSAPAAARAAPDRERRAQGRVREGEAGRAPGLAESRTSRP